MELRPRAVTAAQAINNSLPELLPGHHTTTSSALKPERYIGGLRKWPNYETEVVQSCGGISHMFRIWAANHRNSGVNESIVEAIRVGQESTLQGRIQALVFMVINLVLQHHQHQLRFSDYKSAQRNYGLEGEPDAVLINNAAQIKTVGEIKAWWIPAHHLERALQEEQRLRRVLSQPVGYMLEHQCKYGFITTYKESIFLRQVRYSDGTWGIEYSPLILGSDMAVTGVEPVLSTRQCFFHFARMAEQDGDVVNLTPRENWIERVRKTRV
jgi:hypothetical protein